MNRGLNLPNPMGKLDSSKVLVPGMAEAIWQPLYDSATYPAAGTSALAFFQEAIGVNGKTVADTNMELNGQLAKGQAFLVTGVQVAFYPGGLLCALLPRPRFGHDRR